MNQSLVGTLVERKTGTVVLCSMASKRAEDVRLGFERQLKKIDQFLRLSVTYDRGTEMAEHALMKQNMKMDIYFADPHSPWQRGSNENVNGLLRQYLPKGMDLTKVSQTKLNDIAWLLNTRPSKRFGFETPQELFDREIEAHINCRNPRRSSSLVLKFDMFSFLFGQLLRGANGSCPFFIRTRSR